MILIVKQRTGARGLIILHARHEEKLIFQRIPERLDSLVESPNSARAEASVRKTVVVIARADHARNGLHRANARIYGFALCDFRRGKGGRRRASNDIRNAVVAKDRKHLERDRTQRPKRINLGPHLRLLCIARSREKRAIGVKANHHAHAITFRRHVHKVQLDRRKDAFRQTAIVRNASGAFAVERQTINLYNLTITELSVDVKSGLDRPAFDHIVKAETQSLQLDALIVVGGHNLGAIECDCGPLRRTKKAINPGRRHEVSISLSAVDHGRELKNVSDAGINIKRYEFTQ